MLHCRFGKTLASAFGATLLLAAEADAICLEPSPVRVCTEFYRSDAVIVGKVLSERKFPDTPDPNNIEGWIYKFQIDKTYWGKPQGTIELYTGNDETHFPMEVGRSYLLFVSKNAQGRVAPDTCGNSAELSKADAALKAIDKILAGDKSSAGASIGGRVNLPVAGSQAMSDAVVPGVAITAHGFGRDFTVKTDKEGRFDIHVPPGSYSVTGESEGWNLVPYALSYMKADNFAVRDGSCADFQFLAEPK